MQRKRNVVVLPPPDLETKLIQENRRILKSILSVKSEVDQAEPLKYAEQSKFISPNSVLVEKQRVKDIKKGNDMMIKNITDIYQKPQLGFLNFYDRQALKKKGVLNNESMQEYLNPSQKFSPCRNHNFLRETTEKPEYLKKIGPEKNSMANLNRLEDHIIQEEISV